MSKNRVIISKILSKQITVTEAAATYRISRRHLHRLLARARTEGIEAVDPKSRKPKSNPQATIPEIKDRIIKLRQQLSGAGYGVGAKNEKKRIFMLIDDIEVTIVDIATGEVLAVNKVEPELGY